MGTLWQLVLHLLFVGKGRFRGDVTAIGDGVQNHFHTFVGDCLGCRDDVVDVTMHTTVRNHTHKMRGAAGVLQLGDEVLNRGIVKERPVFDRQINLAKVHRHNPARADIGMSNLRVAHLARRQAHIRAVGDQRGVGTGGHHRVEIRSVGKMRRVILCLVAQAPAIEDAQDDRFGNAHGVRLRLNLERGLSFRRRGVNRIICLDQRDCKQRGSFRNAISKPLVPQRRPSRSQPPRIRPDTNNNTAQGGSNGIRITSVVS